MKLPKVNVVLATATGAWLRSEARRLGARLINAPGTMGTARRIIQGFLLLATKGLGGTVANVKVIDPPGEVMRCADSSRYSGSRFPVITSRPSEARDVFSPKVERAPSVRNGNGWLMDIAEKYWAFATPSLTGDLEEGFIDGVNIYSWCGLGGLEMRGAVHSAHVLNLGAPISDSYGIPNIEGSPYSQFRLYLCRAYGGGPARIRDTGEDLLQDQKALHITERAIYAKTGFGFVHRLGFAVDGWIGTRTPPFTTPMQLPFCCVYRSQPETYFVIPVCNTQLPDDPVAWRDDAGVSGLLVVRIDYVESPDNPGYTQPTWGDHYLLRFDEADSPFLQVEEWLPDWPWYPAGSDPDVFYGYPGQPVSGYATNSITSMRAAFKEGLTSGGDRQVTVTAFFAASFGRQHIERDGGAFQTGFVFEQTVLARLEVVFTGRAAPVASVTVLDHDILCQPQFPPYAVYGSGDATAARTFYVRGAEQLEAGARAIVSAHRIRRDEAARRSGPIVEWMHELGPLLLYVPGAYNNWSLGNYELSAAPTSEVRVYGTAKLVDVFAADLGLTWEYNWRQDSEWPRNKTYTPRSGKTWVIRDHWTRIKITTQVGDNKIAISGFDRANAASPHRVLFLYDADGDHLSLLKQFPYTATYGGPSNYPSITCYQREVVVDDEVVMPFCLVASFWTTSGEDDPAGGQNPATFLSTDGGATFEKLGDYSGAQGVYYLGSKLHPMTYTAMFSEN